MRDDMCPNLFGVAGNPNTVASLVGRVPQVFVYECVITAGFELARKHSENRDPFWLTMPGVSAPNS